MFVPLFKGLVTGAGLIIAIGAQNAFVLKQGLSRNFVLITALFCIIADTLMITLGVMGLGTLFTQNAFLMQVTRWGGVAFLLFYGLRSFISVFSSHTLSAEEGEAPSLIQSILILFAVTFLNPHFYLDAFVLLGSIGSNFHFDERPFFAGGAVLASVLWFFTLAYGARLLAPVFKKKTAWKVLDFLIGCMMWGIALSLIFMH